MVLNADSPTLPTALLIETAAVLARPGDRAVLGPSSDGGYYLLGLKTAHRRMFEDIAWSTERVAEQTLERAREIGLDVHTCRSGTMSTISTACSRLHAELVRRRFWPRRAACAARAALRGANGEIDELSCGATTISAARPRRVLQAAEARA